MSSVIYRSLTELQTAFDAYTVSKSTVPTVFQLGPGTMTITGSFNTDFTVPANCTLRGAGMDGTIITSENQGTIYLGARSVIEDLQIRRRRVQPQANTTATSQRVFFHDVDGDVVTSGAYAFDNATHNLIDCEYRFRDGETALFFFVGDSSSMVIRNLRNRRADKMSGAIISSSSLPSTPGSSLHATNCEFGHHAAVPERCVFSGCTFRPASGVSALSPINITLLKTLTYTNCIFDMTLSNVTFGTSYAGSTMNLFHCSVVGNTLPLIPVGTVNISTPAQ